MIYARDELGWIGTDWEDGLDLVQLSGQSESGNESDFLIMKGIAGVGICKTYKFIYGPKTFVKSYTCPEALNCKLALET